MDWSSFSGQTVGVSPYNTSPARRPQDSVDISPTSPSGFMNYFPPQSSLPRDVPNQARYRNLEVPQSGGYPVRGSMSRQASNQSNGSAAPRHDNFTGPHSAPSSHTIFRFQQDPEAPWIPRTAITNIEPDVSPLSHPQIYDFSTLRNTHSHSDAFSDAGLPGPADSAYVSQTTAQSIYSAPVDSLSESIDPQLEAHLRIDDASTVRSSVVGSERRARRTSRASSIKKYTPQKCKYCDEVPKCESDHKKHMLKHEKIFYCDVKGCKRISQGFGTVNDLNRHKKSVHKLNSHGTTKSYRCAARSCEKSDKDWPRYDNFKQHVVRVHKDEHNDEEKLISDIVERSEIRNNQQRDQASLAPQAMPMQEALAGMELQPPGDTSNGYTVSPENLNLTLWPHGTDQFRQSEDQGIYANQFPPGPARPEQLNKDGQTIHHLAPPSSIDEAGQNVGHSYGSKSPEQGLNALADVAMAAAPTVTVTDAPRPLAEKPNDVKMSGFDDVGSSSSASRHGDSEKLNRLVEDSIGSNLPPDERLEVVKTLSSLVASMPGKVVEMLKKTQTDLESGVKKPGRPSSHASSSSLQSESGITCSQCGKKLPRSCDMKKHFKRHTKPYGCTFPRCHKVFGSKNDWKRHENSQHFQQEMWRCQVPVAKHATSDGKCGQVFYYADMFSHHLKSAHSLSDRGKREEMKQSCRIGRSGNTRFWCGFCKDIIPVSGARGQAAWDERFNHIDEKHYKSKQRIDDWLCIETRVPKGEQGLLKQQPILDQPETAADRNVPDEVSDEDGPAFRGGSGPPPLESPRDSPQQEEAAPSSVMQNGAAQVPQFRDDQMPSDQNPEGIYCCQCRTGPFFTFYGRCGTFGDGCDHDFCRNCYAMSGVSVSR